MDVLLLSRIQFALTTAFHYLFPPLSIGLGLLLVIMEAVWLKLVGGNIYDLWGKQLFRRFDDLSLVAVGGALLLLALFVGRRRGAL